jgi:glucosamine-phosphate N-acetyltransferase
MSSFVSLYEYILTNSKNLSEIKEQYLKLLSELTKVTEISDKTFFENIVTIHQNGLIIVGLENNVIVASGTIIIEPKIIRGGKSVGHIEDIVVTKSYRGKGYAQEVLQKLKEYGFSRHCYKIILDCHNDLEPFYEKVEFKQVGIQMAMYNPDV